MQNSSNIEYAALTGLFLIILLLVQIANARASRLTILTETEWAW